MESALVSRRCKPCEGGIPALAEAQARELISQVGAHWNLATDGKSIQAQFNFRNYWQTTAFVNAVIWVAHQEDHHPDINFGYKACTITYSTHAIGGLSENDFICAAKVDALLRKPD
jgi:4a-hydroxytetrahydrobiopterin dehydratase